jgi:hypothetical protein
MRSSAAQATGRNREQGVAGATYRRAETEGISVTPASCRQVPACGQLLAEFISSEQDRCDAETCKLAKADLDC